MSWFYTIFFVFLLHCCISLGDAVNIETVDELREAIKKGPHRKVGFLSSTNYQSVKTILPKEVEVVVCDSRNASRNHGIHCEKTDDIVELVKNGTILAGLISGLPETHHEHHLHIFSSTLISPRAMFMTPDHSYAYPHGAIESKSSRDLAMALNAAIVRVQTLGLDQQARLRNMPFEFLSVHTCKSNDYAAFPLPNKKEATGLLKDVFENKKFKLGAFGPYDWGDNDGNYLVDPPKGFYPDLMEAIMQQFRQLSGPDNETYGEDIQLERVWSKTATFRDLFDGRSHATEPYYLIDASYFGTGEDCETNNDCRPANLPGGHELCLVYKDAHGKVSKNPDTGEPRKTCQHPERARIDFFKFSCTTMGADHTFFTKRHSGTTSVGARIRITYPFLLSLMLVSVGVVYVVLNN